MHLILQAVSVRILEVPKKLADSFSLTQACGYKLVRVSKLDNAEALAILHDSKRIVQSKAELNDGSWEFGMPTSRTREFQNLVQRTSDAYVDLEYNPLRVPEEDCGYFGFDAALYLSRTWLQGRASHIYGGPRQFYLHLICIQGIISSLL